MVSCNGHFEHFACSITNDITPLLITTARFTIITITTHLDELLDWREIQTLTRSMPDFHKTLILVNVKGDSIEELAMASEHAPFRHRPKPKEVGGQVKKTKAATNDSTSDDSDNKKPRLGEKEDS